MRSKDAAVFGLGIWISVAAQAQQPAQVMQGDERLACEAIICLAASTRPQECVPAIRRYFSISYRRFSDTLRGRMNFLNLCPSGNAPGMSSLKSALVNGAGRCDAASLNITNWVGDSEGGGTVSNSMTDYCSAMASNAYIAADTLPRYVGEPGRGGYWVEAKDFEAASRSYAESLAKSSNSVSTGGD